MPQKRSQRVSAVVRPSAEMLAKAREDMAQPLSQVKYVHLSVCPSINSIYPSILDMLFLD